MISHKNPTQTYMMVMPVTFNSGEPIPQHITDNWLYEACEAFGGATATEARGLWSDSGKVYDEPMTRVDCFQQGPETMSARGFWLQLGRKVLEEGKQESVMLMINGELIFLTK
jgi:hypothetical protein